MRPVYFLPLLALLLLTARAAPAQNPATQSYTTITGIRVSALSNGVQIRVAADGILQFRAGGGTAAISTAPG